MLEELQRVCVLVQGCWVVRSEVLYPKDFTSPHNGVCSDVLCRARDLAVGDCMGAGLIVGDCMGAGLIVGDCVEGLSSSEMQFVIALLPFVSS